MRHHASKRKLGLKTKGRTALLRSLARSLIIHEKISTTEAKAKEVRPLVEKLITKGKENSVASRRFIIAELGTVSKTAKKVVDVLSPKYQDRKGGYTRIIKLPTRKSDSAKQAIIEFV
jgi:large subunit ribosomal protein L17